jgi:nucleoside-diphosphate-sugar epimerase
MMSRLFNSDLAWVIDSAQADLMQLQGEKIFFTGGTGFIGSWFLECLCYANQTLGLRVHTTVLSRDPASFAARFPHLAEDSSIELVAGDVRSLEYDGCNYGMVIHAATDASAQLNRENPLLMADTIVEGTRRVLEFARSAGARRVLMLSSGGVYGKFMPGTTHVPEDYPGGPDPLNIYYTYSESKRMAELLCAIFAHQFGLEIPVARVFALVGPRLPLDIHFAAGNFIRDGLAGGPIRVAGDGIAVRSYLYAADLIVWLLAILARGNSGRAYNVGSDQGVSIALLAETVATVFPNRPTVEIAGLADASNPVNYYVPDVTRARDELGLKVSTSLIDGISRTVSWLQQEAV